MFQFLLPTILFAFGSAMIAYPDYASQKGWPVGAKYRNPSSSQDLFAFGGMVYAVVWAFILGPWWIALLVIPVGYFVALFFTSLAKHWIQVVAPVGIIALWFFSILVRLD